MSPISPGYVPYEMNPCCYQVDEMKDICSQGHSFILMNDVEALRHFIWETLELKRKMPTLAKMLARILQETPKIISIILCKLLKHQYSKMSLMQQAIFV